MHRPMVSVLACASALALALTGCSTSPAPSTSGPEPPAENRPQADYSQTLVSYLGPEGTYTQEACGAFFGGEGTYLPQETVPDSVDALVKGEVDYTVIPQENTIGGAIADYLDEVVSHEDVCVVGEVELSISQNLLAHAETTLEDIKTVYSHKQGITQGTAWLKEHLPDAEVIEVSSTAEGARMASDDKSGTCAAIGSFAAAEVYGLEVTADNIQMNDANKTRFYVLAMGEPAKEASDRMAFIASGDVGDLAELLTSVEGQGLEIVSVHDRPEKTELGRYTFLVECTGGGYDSFEKVVSESPSLAFRYLGSFPVR